MRHFWPWWFAHDGVSLSAEPLDWLRANLNQIQLHESLNAHIKIARIHRSQERWAQRLSDEQAEHVEIVEALRARDPERVRLAMRHHIGRAAQNLIEDLRRAKETTRE